MAVDFTPASTAGAWQISTPSILGAAALYGSLKIVEEAGLEEIRAKSLDLTGWMMTLVDEWLSEPPYGFGIGTPREPERRGGHIALEHPEGVQICKALKTRGIIPDFRPPNVIRVAPSPLYTTYDDLWQLVQAIREIVDAGEHLQLSAARAAVS